MVWGPPKDGDLRGWGGLGEHGNDCFVPGRCSPYRHFVSCTGLRGSGRVIAVAGGF